MNGRLEVAALGASVSSKGLQVRICTHSRKSFGPIHSNPHASIQSVTLILSRFQCILDIALRLILKHDVVLGLPNM